jgi:hypothetical protein
MSNLPSTATKVFQYADDIAVTYQAKTFDEYQNNLEADIEVLNQFFHRWCRIQEKLNWHIPPQHACC